MAELNDKIKEMLTEVHKKDNETASPEPLEEPVPEKEEELETTVSDGPPPEKKKRGKKRSKI